MTTKGQVTIPKRIRDHLGLKPGSAVEFTIVGDGQIGLRTREKKPESRFAALRGTVDLGMTTDEFMRSIRGDPQE
jgi:AbrB family looped-hinge helix DNA binding protein